MIRFLLGFAVGALLLAAIQYTWSPLPSTSATGIAGESPGIIAPATEAGDGQAGSNLAVDRGDTLPTVTSAERGDADCPEVTDDEADGASSGTANPIELPDTHAGFVDRTAPSLPDEHERLENEDRDESWAEFIEQQIYSFITSHPLGEHIQIVSLVCRTTLCEIVGTVYGGDSGEYWDTVLSDMQSQPWFTSNFSNSAYGAGGGLPGEFRFIALLARTGSQVEPPVQQ